MPSELAARVPVQSTTIDGLSVVLYPGRCFVSKGFHFGSLEEVIKHRTLHSTGDEYTKLTDHQITLVKQWAQSHGYIKERRIARTQASPVANWIDGFPHPGSQRTLSLDKPRLCAKPRSTS